MAFPAGDETPGDPGFQRGSLGLQVGASDQLAPALRRGRLGDIGYGDFLARARPPSGGRVHRLSSRRSSSTVISWCRATLFRMLDSVFTLIGVCSGITS